MALLDAQKALLVLAAMTQILAAQARELDYPEKSGAQLGEGWNSHAEEVVHARCVDFATTPGTANGIMQAGFRLVRNTYDLSEHLQLSANVQAAGLVGSFAGRYEFVKDQTLKEDSTTLLGSATIEWDYDTVTTPAVGAEVAGSSGPVGGIPSVRLRQAAIEYLKDAPDGSVFFRNCGDSFVSGLAKGAELFGVMKLSKTTSTHAQTIAKSAELKGFGVGVKLSWNSGLELARSAEYQDIDFRTVGGSPVGLPKTVNELATALDTFAKSPSATGRPRKIVLAQYSGLPDWPKDIPDQPRFQLIDLVRQIARIDALLNQYLEVDGRPDDYIFDWGVSLSEFTVRLTEVKRESDALRARLKECVAASEDLRRQKCAVAPEEAKTLDTFTAWLPLAKETVPAYQDLMTLFLRAQQRIDSFNGFRGEWLCTASRHSTFGKRNRMQGANLCDVLRVDENWCDQDYDCKRYFLSQSMPFLRDQVSPAVNAFLTALEAFPKKLKSESGEQRFAGPWRQRCRINAGGDLCIGVGPGEIGKLVETIPIALRSVEYNGRRPDGYPLQEPKTGQAAALYWK